MPMPKSSQDGARAARAAAAEHAGQAEMDRRLAAPVVHAIIEAGFARHFVPARFGGDGGSFAAFLERTATVAEGCASAGWCASLFASHARIAAFLPEAGRRDLWSSGPDVLICAAVIPAGRVTRAAGGWSLSGEWGYVSGIDHADWILLSGWEPGVPDRRVRYFAVPRRECTVKDTWFAAGLRGTGSKTAVLHEVMVPEHRSFAQPLLLTGDGEAEHAALRVPFRLVNGLSMIAPALGAARGALGRWSAWIADKTEMAMASPVRARDRSSVQAALTRSAAAIDATGMLMDRIASLADSGRPVPYAAVAQSHRDYAVAAEYLADAVERLFRASGARAQLEDGPVERAWRDVHAAASHAAVQFDKNAAVYAGFTLGEPADG